MASLTSKPRLLSGDSQRPRIHVTPRYTSTDGDIAGSFASAYGLAPDSWQRFVLDDWLGVKGGRWAALTCGLAVPRQNGKNALLEIRELYGMVGLGEKILHTAHEVKTAQKHFRRLKHFFGNQVADPGAKYPELNALVKQVRSVNGQEAILLHSTSCEIFVGGVCRCDGGSVEVIARSKNSGRGFTVDVLVMDEAQELGEDSLEALMPTTSAAPLGNPQWIFTGTPPGPSARGEVFTRVRTEARGKSPGSVCWSEWSVDQGSDLDKVELWRMTNPALDAGRLQLAVLKGERARFSDDGFGRERLGMWAPDAGEGSRLVSAEVWARQGRDAEQVDALKVTELNRTFGITFSIDGKRVSVAGGMKHGDGAHAEVVDGFSGHMSEGVDALAAWLAEETRRNKTALYAISGRSHAEVLKSKLVERGVPSKAVHILNSPEYFTACSMYETGLRDGSVTHSADEAANQTILDRSVAVCDKKLRGTAGSWGWEVTVPGGDETPMEAVSVAVWAALTTKRRPGRKSRAVVLG